MSVDPYCVEYQIEGWDYPNTVLTNCMFRCTRCGEWKPASEFGLCCDDNDVIRNQPQCTRCRHEKPKLRSVP